MNKKISIISIIFIITFLVLGCLNVCNAKVTSTDPTATSGENVSITITTSNAVQCFKIELVDNGGLTFVSVNRNSTFTSGNTNGSTINGASTDGSGKTLATYTFKTPEVTEKTTYKVQFSVTGMDNESDTTNTSTVTVNPKAKPPTTTTEPGPQTNTQPETTTKPENTQPTPSTQTEPQPEEPKAPTLAHTFKDVNETVYVYKTESVNVRELDSASSKRLGGLSKDTAVTRTGISTDGSWSRVIYNGKTAYISSDYLTKEKPEEPETNTVTNTVTNEIANVVVGEVTNTTSNEIANTVANEISDENIDDSGILRLKSLEIKGADISEVFKPYIYEYKVNVASSVTKLEIEAEPNLEDATVEIMGNDEFVQGENIVTIMLKSTDGQVATYQITVNVGEEAQTEDEGFDLMYVLYILLALIVVIIIAIIIIKIKMSKSEDYEEDYDEEELNDIANKYGKGLDDNSSNIFDYDKETSDDNSMNIDNDNDDNFDGDEDDDKSSRRRGGKHF